MASNPYPYRSAEPWAPAPKGALGQRSDSFQDIREELRQRYPATVPNIFRLQNRGGDNVILVSAKSGLSAMFRGQPEEYDKNERQVTPFLDKLNRRYHIRLLYNRESSGKIFIDYELPESSTQEDIRKAARYVAFAAHQVRGLDFQEQDIDRVESLMETALGLSFRRTLRTPQSEVYRMLRGVQDYGRLDLHFKADGSVEGVVILEDREIDRSRLAPLQREIQKKVFTAGENFRLLVFRGEELGAWERRG